MGKFFKSRPPFWHCPKPECRSDRFGVLSIYDHHYTRRCNSCDFDQMLSLPIPQKKIIYLDQTAISHIVKARIKKAEKKWADLEELLKRAINCQAICCPHSEAHETESIMDIKYRDDYKDLFQNLSINTRLQSPHDVDMNHVAIALNVFEGGPPHSPWPKWRNIFRENPNIWTPDMYITVNMGGRREQEARFRQVKLAVKAALDGVNDFVKTSPKTFEEHFQSETKQYAKNVVEQYRKNLLLMAKAQTPEEHAHAFLQGSVYGDTMNYILRKFGRGNPGTEEAATFAGKFLSSATFADMPHIRISSAVFAEISMRAKRGSKGFKASDLTDVDVISHYAPYCDAMFVDNEMRSILTTNPVMDKVSLNTIFFSSSNFNEFTTFVEECIRNRPKEITEKTLEVYGDRNPGDQRK